MWIAAVAAVAALAALAGCGGGAEPRFDVLVFTRTSAFRHTEAIEAGRAALERMGGERGFSVTATEEWPDDLARFEVVVLLQMNGNGLIGDREGFERWVRGGGGVVAVHAAANAERDWPFYAALLGGARFRNHPPGAAQFQGATVHVRDFDHPATKAVPRAWARTDEWYNFAPEPGRDAHVLAVLDEREYDEADGTSAADPHPIAWTAAVGDGRSLYTALGPGGDAWGEEPYRAHVLGAVEWAAGH